MQEGGGGHPTPEGLRNDRPDLTPSKSTPHITVLREWEGERGGLFSAFPAAECEMRISVQGIHPKEDARNNSPGTERVR